MSRHYRWIWWISLLVVSIPSLALGMWVSPVPALVIAATLLGLSLGVALVDEDLAWRRWFEVAVGAALVGAAAPVFGQHTLPLMLLAAGSSPPTVRVVARLVGMKPRTRVPGGSRGKGGEISACLASMSGAELCELWSRSFSMVKSPTDLSHRYVGASLRRSVLDELERRDGAVFARWLARHPSPASEPGWVTAVGQDPAP
jgi:hypothetical protein